MPPQQVQPVPLKSGALQGTEWMQRSLRVAEASPFWPCPSSELTCSHWNCTRTLWNPWNPSRCALPLHGSDNIRAFGWGYMVIIDTPRGQPLEPLLLQRAWGIAPNPTPVESLGAVPQTPLHIRAFG